MVVQRKMMITESEKSRILKLYGINSLSENIVITEWLSPDEKYCIFFDDLIDIENKTKIGNIWENFDHFKFFLKHSFEVTTNVSQEIKESVLKTINSLLITESNQSMVGLKPYVKQLLSEQNFFTDAKDWVKNTTKDAIKGVEDFTTTSIDGLKKVYTNIKDGEWNKAFEIIKKGVLYVARSIRSALYSPIGILLDAILLATGIGKSLQFVIWSVVVGLDVYELMSGNFENPDISMPWRLLLFGIDILGLVFSGAAAKASKTWVGSLIRQFGKGADGFTNAVRSSKPLQETLKKILSSTQSAGGLMQRAATYLKTKAPKIYNFLSKSFNAVGGFIKKMIEILSSILKGTYKAVSAPGKSVKNVLGGKKLGSAAQSVVNVGIPTLAYGAYATGKEKQQNQQLTQAITGTKVKPDYNSVEW
jgi:hypothetical protein